MEHEGHEHEGSKKTAQQGNAPPCRQPTHAVGCDHGQPVIAHNRTSNALAMR